MHEYGLTALGRYQTFNLAVKTNVKFDLALVSDTRRTLETYEILNMAAKMPPLERCIITPILREKCQGMFEMQDFCAYLDNPLDRFTRPEGNGECWNDVHERVLQTMEFIIRRFLFKLPPKAGESPDVLKLYELTDFEDNCKNILLITHYGFIKELVHYLRQQLQQKSNDNPYFAQNASIFTLQIYKTDNNSWDCRVISLNSYTKQYRPFM